MLVWALKKMLDTKDERKMIWYELQSRDANLCFYFGAVGMYREKRFQKRLQRKATSFCVICRYKQQISALLHSPDSSLVFLPSLQLQLMPIISIQLPPPPPFRKRIGRLCLAGVLLLLSLTIPPLPLLAPIQSCTSITQTKQDRTNEKKKRPNSSKCQASNFSSSTVTQQLKWITQHQKMDISSFPACCFLLSRNKVINWASEVSGRSMQSCRLQQQTSSDLWLLETWGRLTEEICVWIYYRAGGLARI